MSAGVWPGTSSAVASTLADPEGLAVLEQVVELAAVGQEAALQVVELLERRLHLADVLADGDAAAHALLQVARARQVVGVRMRLQDPLDLSGPLSCDVGQHLVGRAVSVWPDLKS